MSNCRGGLHRPRQPESFGAGAVVGAEVTLRWVYHHMIAEYAGHADLLGELIAGTTGG